LESTNSSPLSAKNESTKESNDEQIVNKETTLD